MKLEELLVEQDGSDAIFQVRVRGNFYDGKYYATGMDSIFVLASSADEATRIAKDNVDALERHFRSKKYSSGKTAIAKNDQRKFTPNDVGRASASAQKQHNKVLHRDGTIGPASVVTESAPGAI